MDRFQTTSAEVPFSPSVERKWYVAVDSLNEEGDVDAGSSRRRSLQRQLQNPEPISEADSTLRSSPEKKRSKRSQRSSGNTMSSLLGGGVENENNKSLLNVTLQTSLEKAKSDDNGNNNDEVSKEVGQSTLTTVPIASRGIGNRGKRGAASASSLLTLGTR